MTGRLVLARVVGVALLLLLLVAWGSDRRSPISVRGMLRETGMGASLGVGGSVTAMPSTGAERTVLVGPSGRFSMRLKPGVYQFIGHSLNFGGGLYPCEAFRPVTVVRHAVARVNVDCSLR